MSHKRLTTWQKATALVPLALLSGAWTTSLAVTSTASASQQDTTTLPDGTTVPNEAIEVPASLTQPGSIAPGVPEGAEDQIVASASTNGIPDAALAAYQRAEQVINSADKSCNLSWQLLAAVGRVESDHGRYGNNVLGDDGKSRPGIYGIPLDGSNNTAQIKDTDAGQYDDDQVWDRAVGPMQFIPSTWSVVGVDGDGDGTRDPQDIDDAALASAVYLCSGDEDLSTDGGQRAAIYRYNHSQEYVDLVISIMNAYLAGDFSSVPNGVGTATVFTPSFGDSVFTPAITGKPFEPRGAKAANARGNRGGSGSSGSGSGGGGTTAGGGGTPAPSVPTDEGSTSEPTKKVEDTVKKTTDTVKKTTDDTVKKTEDAVKKTTSDTLTKAQATEICLVKEPLNVDACVARLLG